MKGFLLQLISAIKGDKYPSVYVWGYWEHSFKNGECNYKHWKTLYNYITNNRILKKK